MEVVIKATPSWYCLYDCLEDEGFDVKLSHPLRTKAIAAAKIKTDKVGLGYSGTSPKKLLLGICSRKAGKADQEAHGIDLPYAKRRKDFSAGRESS